FERRAADGLALLQPAEEGAQWLGYVAGTIEGEPRFEQVGAGLHPLAIDPQPKSVRLRAGAEAQRRCATLSVHQGAEFVERQRRRLALRPDCLGAPMWPYENVRQRCQVREEVGDGATGQCERRVRRIGIGESIWSENVETNEHLDVCHCSELARADA